MTSRVSVMDVVVPSEGATVDVPAGAAMLVARCTGTDVLVQVVARDRPASRGNAFADLVRRAERRDGHVLNLPARDVVAVGHWDAHQGELRLYPTAAGALAGWIGHRPYRNDLEAADSAFNTRQDARLRARRLDMQGRRQEAMALRHRHNVPYW